MKDVFITSMGHFLPNKSISNDEMEDFLGRINGESSRAKKRVLDQNGIKTRYYAIDENQKTTHSNSKLAANSISEALKKSNLSEQEIELLVAATTQGDLPIPGFASMIHGEVDGFKEIELGSFQSVCASGVMALNDAFAKIKSNLKSNAVVVGSELASRLFKSTRFEKQGIQQIPFDTEFLRWMLSDGAGSAVLQNSPNKNQLSLKIDWIDLKSHANKYPLCMFTGKNDNKNDNEITWLDYPSYEEASANGAINLKQDIRLLDDVIKVGVRHYFELIDKKQIDIESIDWLCCHYSSEYFKKPILELMEKGGGLIPEEKWFSNLTSKGNTGSASIFIMLEELLYSGKLKAGQKILCMVPESGRFITSFMMLTVVDGQEQAQQFPTRKIESPELILNKTETSEWLIRQLTQIWIDFEGALLKTPIVNKIHSGTLNMDDYQLLLHDLRQQVIDGSQWISRAASNIDIELFDLRSAFIQHTATEHKDYQLLEKNYLNCFGENESIKTGQKNIGSHALSSFMFNQASQRNPVDLLGAMFIIEGIGKRLAGFWGEMIQEQLHLNEDQVSFFTYHGVADENHFKNLEEALNHDAMNFDIAQKIAQTAKITAKLYHLQLQELGNY